MNSEEGAGDAYDSPLFYLVMQYAHRADRDVVDMVSGSPDWDPPAAVREGLREYADGDPADFQYPPSEGLRRLREEMAARRNVDSDRVVVTNGAGEANYLAMARAMERDAGEEMVLTDPVYPYYPGKAQMLGASATKVPVATDGSLDLDAMRAAVSEETACVVVNTPNNPTGAVYDRESVAELVALAEENDALLLVDEVYDHFDFSGRFESALTFDSENVVVTSAYSKTMAITGFRVGYAVFPESLVEAAKTRHMLVNVATSRPAQAAVLRALEETPPEYYEAARDRLRDRIDAFTDALDAAGASYTDPDGGFYVLARFEEFPGTLENVKKLIDEAGVAGMPGEAFGEAYDDWIRFALCTPRADDAAARLADYFSASDE
ncbi:pyridoxal phosphate-dependent aminotransferase [Halopelagius longus]|uniref:Aspartate/methionine/tyrosine aminotransferase n=1 Tax=Halopelagius longus TaxID=1236180 RepID=A0A1H1DAR2_9EURY|nr:pyridoxal phosphate-dependent aminotransferase [Halopelagius longus]RDI71255.1 pyridoxal phosphate-dependent aminotransferase [Halopelagius longus]SDQ73635.1 Aspartate/methionine/tyrosine aminotransferase [Halopelagius longus]